MATSEHKAHQQVSSDMIGECKVINLCEPCTRKHTPSKATLFCKTCNEHLCEHCRNSHIIYKSGKHDTVVIENLDSAPVVVMMKGMDKCRDHDKKVKFFCEDHSKLCCNTCAFIHRKCEIINELANLSSQEGLELQGLNHMLLKLETETCSIIADCNLSEAALSETNAYIPKQVDEMKDRIIEIFDKAKSRMIEEADNFKAEEMKRLGERRKATSNVNEDIHELLPVSSALVKHGTPQQKYIISHIMKEKIKYIETHITEQRNKHITSTVALNFSNQLSSLLKEDDGIVKLNTRRLLTHKDIVQKSPTKMQKSSVVKKETTVLKKDVVLTSPMQIQESYEVKKETTVLNKDVVQTSPTKMQESSVVKKETTVLKKDDVLTSPMQMQGSSEVKKETTVLNKDVVQTSPTKMQESSEVKKETTVLKKDVVLTNPMQMQESSEVKKKTTVLNKDVVLTCPMQIQKSSEVKKETTVLNKDVVQISPAKMQESSKVMKETTLLNKDVVQTSPMRIQDSSAVKKETTVTILHKGCSSHSAKSAPIKPVIMELLVSVDIKQAGGDNEVPFLSGLDFLQDGRLVAVDYKNCKCIIMDGRLKKLGKPYKFNTIPLDIVCLCQCEVAVTTYDKTVCLLSVGPDNVISLTKTISTSTQVFSICCMAPTNMVVSTFNDPRPVKMITKGGVESDCNYVMFPEKTFKLDESNCTYVQSKDTLVLTDRCANTVYMYDTFNGTCRAITYENIQQPRGACVGPDDTVLVCSGAKNSIVHMTVHGDIIGTYPVDTKLPYTLCMSKDGSRLAVSGCDTVMRKLIMYTLS